MACLHKCDMRAAWPLVSGGINPDGQFLVALTPIQDLLFSAKYLFIDRHGGGCLLPGDEDEQRDPEF